MIHSVMAREIAILRPLTLMRFQPIGREFAPHMPAKRNRGKMRNHSNGKHLYLIDRDVCSLGSRHREITSLTSLGIGLSTTCPSVWRQGKTKW